MDAAVGGAALLTAACCCSYACSGGGAGGSGAAAASGGAGQGDIARLWQQVADAERALRSKPGAEGHASGSAGEAEAAASVPDDDDSADWLSRTRLLLGDESLARLAQKHVLVVGLGGVGGFATECLVRGGIGHVTIVDGDTVDPTNRNRQLVALRSNHGQPKAQALAKRCVSSQLSSQPASPDLSEAPGNASCTCVRAAFVPADPCRVRVVSALCSLTDINPQVILH